MTSHASFGWSWAGPTSPFLDPDSPFPEDRLTDAVVAALRTGGVERVTLGAVAKELGVSSQAAHKLAGSRTGFLESVVRTFLDRRWRWLTGPPVSPARLPTDNDEVHGLRVFRSLTELAVGEHRAGRPALVDLVASDRRRHRDWVSYLARDRCDRPMTEDELDGLEAIVDGLTAAVLRPIDPMSTAQASRILDDFLAATGWRPEEHSVG